MSIQLLTILPNLWRALGSDKAQLPQNWETVLNGASTILAEVRTPIPSDYDTLDENIRKIINNWKFYSKDWSVTSYQQLHDKILPQLADTLATSYSSETATIMQHVFDSSKHKLWTSQGSFSSGQMKEIMSTSSMIAPIPADSADAELCSTKKFADRFRSLLEESSSCRRSTPRIGRMYSYISECQNGLALAKLGLEEDYKDLRITIKVYDGKKCREDPEKYWRGKLRELDITVSETSNVARTVEALFQRVACNLENTSGACVKETQSWQGRRRSSHESRDRYNPY